MADIGQAFVQIVPSAKGMKGSIESIIDPEAQSAGKSSGATLGNNLVASLKGVLGAAAIGATVKQIMDAGGALQQSFGGLETIYGNGAEYAKELANAAAAAGISANDWAEQAVSFGASLKKVFGSDTKGAVDAANTAILDMADNAAKMGTPLQSIQNAYAGFARQNYTMLDNLKLGYGGTKAEMERLLDDAKKLTGVKYNINNLADVYAAIHAIQGNLGLTGVAAAEASETFTGSMGAMKAAAQNLMANIALGGDLETPFKVLIGNLNTFLIKNLIPMIVNIIKSIPTVIVQTVQGLSGFLESGEIGRAHV